MKLRATISVELRKNDGTTVRRTVEVESNNYPRRETNGVFKARVRRQANAALNSVLGSPDGLKIDASV